MYRTPKSLVAFAAAVALFSVACAGQTPTGASTGAPERPGITPTAAAAAAPTRPAAAATTALVVPATPAPAPTVNTPAPGTTPGATTPAGSATAEASPPAGATAAPTVVAATATTAAPAQGNATAGRSKFTGDAGCSACHGDRAQGTIGPKLSGTALTLDQVRSQTRSPRDPSKGMPPFGPSVVSDADIANIYAWLKTNP